MGDFIFSFEQARSLDSSMNTLVGRLTKENVGTVIYNMMQMVSNQLKDAVSYTNANDIMRALTSSKIELTPFKSDDELNNVLNIAYKESETSSSLTLRDRVILRILYLGALGVIALSNFASRSFDDSGSLKFDSEGKISTYKSVVDAFPTKNIKELLTIGSDVIKDVYSAILNNPTIDNSHQEMFNLIVPIFLNSFNSKMGTTYKSSDDLTLVTNTMMIGPSYIVWLANKKWKIDITWTG